MRTDDATQPDPLYVELMRPGPDALDALARLLEVRPAWHRDAACRGMGTDAFFPGRGDDVEPARAICAQCSVREPCAAAAAADRSTVGIWAGQTPGDRMKARRAA